MKKDKKKKKSTYSCFEEKYCREYNPIKHIMRWGRNIKHAYQRIKYGYCERDVWSIDWWFLNVVPNMLEDLRDTAHGYPDSPDSMAQAIVDTGRPEDVDDAGMKRWQDTLTEMVFLLREANEDTCTRLNPYEEEYLKADKRFTDMYGHFGDGLKTAEELAKEKEKGCRTMYTMDRLPENKEIHDKYFAEEREIDKYRSECKDKALDLFKLWFWNLWD